MSKFISSFTIDEVAVILDELGYTNLRSSGSVIKCSCPCSAKGDRPFSVIADGLPGYHCHRCRKEGRLTDLVWNAWFAGKGSLKAMLIVQNRYQEWLLSEKKVFPTKMSYVPMGAKPELSTSYEPPKPVKPILNGEQISMPKMAVVTAEKPSEADLSKFKTGPCDYLTSRGFSPRAQELLDVRVNVWAKRVVFPVRVWSGELLAWSQRRLYEGPSCPKCGTHIGQGKDMDYKCKGCGKWNAKYLHSKGFRKSNMLYGEWLHLGSGVPLLMEGMTDVLNLVDKSLEDGELSSEIVPLSIMGGAPSSNQVHRLLSAFPQGNIYVVRDNDDPNNYPDLPKGKSPGILMAETLEAMIRQVDPSRSVVHIIPAINKDPGDLTQDEVCDIISFIRTGSTGSLHLM